MKYIVNVGIHSTDLEIDDFNLVGAGFKYNVSKLTENKLEFTLIFFRYRI